MNRPRPLEDKLVTLFGGSGFLGRCIAQELLSCGARVRVASRQPKKGYSLQPLAKLGQLINLRCDITNSAQLEAVIDGADAVVNCVGSFDGDLRALMGQAPGEMARHAAKSGIGAFVHVSAIGADQASPSRYASAKALGEKLVRENFPSASIVRPSVIFGEADNFINMFAGLIQLFPVLPVFGPQAMIQPVYAADVARGIVKMLAQNETHGGKIFELGGPEIFTMLDLNRAIAKAQQRGRLFMSMPDWASALFAALPGTPMSRDQWGLLKTGNIVSGEHEGFAQLGETPCPLENFLDEWMVRYRKYGRFSVQAA